MLGASRVSARWGGAADASTRSSDIARGRDAQLPKRVRGWVVHFTPRIHCMQLNPVELRKCRRLLISLVNYT